MFHIVESLDDQAVESWLLRVARAAIRDYPHIKWTFFCVARMESRHDKLARDLGAEVIHSRYDISDKIRFIRSLREVMKEGHYDILHCHHDIMSAAYLAASAGLPFCKRIVHVHNTSMSLPTPNRLKAELVRKPMRQMCLRMADQIVGISLDALNSLVGNQKHDSTRHVVVHYAVDTERFSAARVDPPGFRATLGLTSEATILLFVGRLTEYKNPRFVVEILKHLINVNQDAVAIFAGIGIEAKSIMELAKQYRLLQQVRLLGFRDDIPNLMVNSDVLIWPSLEDPKEGLGLGIVEAQASGLPILMSRSVPEEAIVVREFVDVFPLSAGAKAWADRIAEILHRPQPNREDSRARVESSSFSMAAGVAELMALYDVV